MSLITRLNQVERLIGNTPLIHLPHPSINLYTKLEYQNFMGSVKSRPAFFILKAAILNGDIDENTTVIESTSGNFGIAVASFCKKLGIKFIPVIDPNINPTYEKLLNFLSWKVEKVTERDSTGGYLLTRIAKVESLRKEIDNAFWTNQYSNKNNMMAHYLGLGTEISQNFDRLDYVFIGVSSCGTISGVSRKLKEEFPTIKVIAVDTVGSVIFGQKPQKRYIPGIGASMVPGLLKEAYIDEVIHIPEIKAVEGCHDLFAQHGIFAGGSTGSSYYAINQYFNTHRLDIVPNVLFLCPDNGVAYVDTIYSEKWVEECFGYVVLASK